MPSCWLVKTEPKTFGWDDLVREGRSVWDGVRNYEAQKHLRSMAVGDTVLVYHSVHGKEIVGIARVVGAAYPDPTDRTGTFSAVDVAPVKPLVQPVGLTTIRELPELSDFALVRRARLSVMPVSPRQLRRLLVLAKTKL